MGVGTCQKLYRKIITSLITLTMLGISFVIVYGLSTIQNSNSDNRYISILISLVISFINLIIIKVIQFTTIFERDYTMNNYQTSLAIKSIIAQLLNSIIVPIIVDIYIKDNIYGKGGLIEDIFILSITNSLVTPFTRLINPYYIYRQILYWYYDSPKRKLFLNQYELNRHSEKIQFQLGSQYVYLVSNFLFTCFFVSLQPVIPVFAIIGLFLNYWVQKKSLFRQSQRPIPGTDKIRSAIYQIIYFGPGAYALGSLTWSIFIKNSNFQSSLLANLIAAGIAVLILLIPYDSIFNNFFENEASFKVHYQDKRIYFPSEYDRLNPSTAAEGVKQYKQFLIKKKEEFDSLPDSQRMELAQGFLQVPHNNVYTGNNFGGNFFQSAQEEVIKNLFLNQCRNGVNPLLLRSALLPERTQEERKLFRSNNQGEKPASHIPQFGTIVNTDAYDYVIAGETQKNLKGDIVGPNDSNMIRVDNKLSNPYSSNIFLGDLGLESTINQIKTTKDKINKIDSQE